ncbi:MAG: thiamine pyrophosphate-dependent enzyme [Gemmataceae bacterium]
MAGMTLLDALQPVLAAAADRVVITTMSSVGLWQQLRQHPRDFHYLPSSMGQAVPLGLGLALARPGLGIIVISGDGGLLMNLGCLVTLAQHHVPVAVVLIDNGLYEVTGGQAVAGAGRTDFAGLAQAAGIGRVNQFSEAGAWQNQAAECLQQPVPTFIHLSVLGRLGQATPSVRETMPEQWTRLRQTWSTSGPPAPPPPTTP